MYFGPAPRIIETELFSSVPEKYRTAAPTRKSGKPGCFLEGPSFDRAGNLYLVDLAFGRIFRVTPEREWEVIVEYDGEPNGLKIHRDGRIFIADRKRGIVILDPASRTIAPLLEGPAGERFKGPNDLIFAANGDLYFTDQGQTGLHDPSGRVYRYSTTGQLHCLVDNVPSPNGLVFNVRETSLFVAATRSNSVWRIPLDGTNEVSRVGLFVQIFSAGPDGLALDEDGNVAVAHPGVGIVWIFSKRGEPLYQVKSCRSELVTNIAYGGTDRKTLYVVDSKGGHVLTAPMPVAGKRMYSHT